MKRFVAGAVAALLLIGGGLFWWQIRADQPRPASQPERAEPVSDELPEGDDNLVGAPPPPVESRPQDREARRFARYDHDRDGIISRNEMMSSRSRDFRELDTDGNNLLSFEEWAVKTSDRFAGADANKDGKLTRQEFATTAPRPHRNRCRC